MPAGIRHMSCCCCGEYAGRWQQHWNRDSGFGICKPCVDWMRADGTPEAEIADLYGTEGTNWGAGNFVEPERIS